MEPAFLKQCTICALGESIAIGWRPSLVFLFFCSFLKNLFQGFESLVSLGSLFSPAYQGLPFPAGTIEQLGKAAKSFEAKEHSMSLL